MKKLISTYSFVTFLLLCYASLFSQYTGLVPNNPSPPTNNTFTPVQNTGIEVQGRACLQDGKIIVTIGHGRYNSGVNAGSNSFEIEIFEGDTPLSAGKRIMNTIVRYHPTIQNVVEEYPGSGYRFYFVSPMAPISLGFRIIGASGLDFIRR